MPLTPHQQEIFDTIKEEYEYEWFYWRELYLIGIARPGAKLRQLEKKGLVERKEDTYYHRLMYRIKPE